MKEQWYHSPFIAFNGGYQMCLIRIEAAGDGEGEGTHVSVYLYLMKGLHNDELEQSGQRPYTIELNYLTKSLAFFIFIMNIR